MATKQASVTPRAGQIWAAVNQPVRILLRPKGKTTYDLAVIHVDPAETPLTRKQLGAYLREHKFDHIGDL